MLKIQKIKQNQMLKMKYLLFKIRLRYCGAHWKSIQRRSDVSRSRGVAASD